MLRSYMHKCIYHNRIPTSWHSWVRWWRQVWWQCYLDQTCYSRGSIPWVHSCRCYLGMYHVHIDILPHRHRYSMLCLLHADMSSHNLSDTQNTRYLQDSSELQLCGNMLGDVLDGITPWTLFQYYSQWADGTKNCKHNQVSQSLNNFSLVTEWETNRISPCNII